MGHHRRLSHDLELVDHFARMIAIADRLQVLADGKPEDAPLLIRGAEGARILAYLAAARQRSGRRCATRPMLRQSSELVSLVNERACRRDLHQQAAIRHLVSQANWIAKGFRLGTRRSKWADWIPIV